MIQPVAKPRLFEFDPIYDTRTDKHYGFSRIGLIGILKIILGIALIGLCIGDMNDGAYRSVNFFGGRVLTWSENPWWPTYGKGIWVGLMVRIFIFLVIFVNFEFEADCCWCFWNCGTLWSNIYSRKLKLESRLLIFSIEIF